MLPTLCFSPVNIDLTTAWVCDRLPVPLPFQAYSRACRMGIDLAATRSWVLLLYPAIAGLCLLSFLLIIQKKKRTSKMPPGPPGWPIVGNVLQLGKKPNESLFHLAKRYGPLMTLRLGMRTTVVVSSPATAKEIFKNNDQLFAGRTVPQAAKCMSHSKFSLVWGQHGPRWRMLRRISSTELFSAKRLNALQHLRRDQVLQTIRLIYEEDFLKGKMVNIGHTVFLTSLNLLANMIFSRNIFGRDSEAAEELKETVTKLTELAGTPNLADFFPFLRFLDPRGICRETTASRKRMFGWFGKLIDDRLSCTTQDGNYAASRGAAERDFLDVLLEHRSDGEGDSEGVKFTKTNMTPFIYDLILAGSETTATTVEWAMAELIRSPHRMKRAQAEIDEVVGRDRKVEESDTQRLPYLQAVVKEIFRLHPAVPLLLPHRADGDCEIAGFVIPEGTQVIVNVWGMGRDPAIWNEPLEFAPERFVGSEIEFKGNHLELIPFGAGRRICPGLPLANRMVHFVIASLLHCFDWSPPDGQAPHQIDMTEKSGLTMQKATPLMAIPTPRLSTSLY